MPVWLSSKVHKAKGSVSKETSQFLMRDSCCCLGGSWALLTSSLPGSCGACIHFPQLPAVTNVHVLGSLNFPPSTAREAGRLPPLTHTHRPLRALSERPWVPRQRLSQLLPLVPSASWHSLLEVASPVSVTQRSQCVFVQFPLRPPFS